ncbi:ring finger protein 126 [Stylonychia lemnae]|uniref:Ring finger protein 126 n=1 Tax=Stylonychia lemnae TaxID=5949 RepID=A0A077ZZ72_STYLE|nr:ring finger protein 126 [Stylonychia lemnae]|eukprot:CDW73803.1 ring finger protein 126 [Stylonychia lemnae]
MANRGNQFINQLFRDIDNAQNRQRFSEIRTNWRPIAKHLVVQTIVTAGLIYLIREISNTNVQTKASINEKEWTQSTLGLILAFVIITWLIQLFMICTNANGFQTKSLILIVYLFLHGIYESFEHFLKGFFLNAQLQGEDSVIESKLIHYVRMTILFIIVIIGFFMLLLIILAFLITRGYQFGNSSSSFANHDDKLNRLRKVPYSELFFEEGRDCPVCLSSFQASETVIELKCSKFHIFHENCLKSWLKSGKDTCPICRKRIEV